jgi:hypothetical protein
MFFSAPYSHIPSAYVPPSMWATKFHTRNCRKQHSFIKIHNQQRGSEAVTQTRAVMTRRPQLYIACGWLNTVETSGRVHQHISALQKKKLFLISNFRRVLNVECWCIWLVELFEYMMMHGLKNPKWNTVPKRRHIKFRHRGITQKKAYNNESCFAKMMVFASSRVYSVVHRFGILFHWHDDKFGRVYRARKIFAQLLTEPKVSNSKQYAGKTENFEMWGESTSWHQLFWRQAHH